MKNKIENILITGASSGIGEALAIYYAQNEAKNLFLSGRNAERLNDVKKRCEEYGCIVHAKTISVTNINAIKISIPTITLVFFIMYLSFLMF